MSSSRRAHILLIRAYGGLRLLTYVWQPSYEAYGAGSQDIKLMDRDLRGLATTSYDKLRIPRPATRDIELTIGLLLYTVDNA